MSTVDFKYRGRTIPLRGIPKYNNTWSCTLYLQEDHELKLALERWMNQATAEGYSLSRESPRVKQLRDSGIYKTIKVIQRDFTDQVSMVEYELKNVFPKNISSVDTDYSQLGNLLEIQVEFSYSHYEYRQLQDTETRTVVDQLIDQAKDVVNSQVQKIKGKIDQEGQRLQERTKAEQKRTKNKLQQKLKPNASTQQRTKGQVIQSQSSTGTDRDNMSEELA